MLNIGFQQDFLSNYVNGTDCETRERMISDIVDTVSMPGWKHITDYLDYRSDLVVSEMINAGRDDPEKVQPMLEYLRVIRDLSSWLSMLRREYAGMVKRRAKSEDDSLRE